MSDSVGPHRRQPTRLPHPWDSPGKNTGVGCHFLLQCMKVKSECEVTQSCLTLSHPMDYSPPGLPSMGFSGQEYWSGVPLRHLASPMPKRLYQHFRTLQSFQVISVDVSRSSTKLWKCLSHFNGILKKRIYYYYPG